MNFKPELCAKVLDGTKSVTRRPVNGDKPCQYVVGKDYAVCPGRGKKQLGRMCVLDVRQEPLGAVDEMDARREGFEDLATFVGYWHKLYGEYDPDAPVWRIEFELIGPDSTDPRVTR